MKEWYSAKDLAGIPGMPQTESAVIRVSKRENWRSQPRIGRGGGREYHITTLPNETREYLAKTHLDTPPNNPENASEAGRLAGLKAKLAVTLDAAGEQRLREQSAVASFALTSKAAARDAAKHLILAAYEQYLGAFGKDRTAVAAEFVVAYNRGEIDIDPVAQRVVREISYPTLNRWQGKIKKGQHLGGGYGHRKGAGRIDSQKELREFIIGFRTQHPRTSKKNLYEALCARYSGRSDLDLPSKRRVEAWVSEYERHQAEVHTAIANPDEWRNKFMGAPGTHAAAFLNEKWEIDSTPADLELVDGRHTLIGIVDVHSARPKLLVSKTSKATAVSLAIRRAIVDWGVPQVIKGDNGQEYVSNHQARIAAALGIELQFSNKFSPWEKPHIERFFHTFSHGLVELLPGFIGHNVADRQAIRARQSFSERLFKKNQVVELKMTAAELQAFCDDWCEKVYAHETHDGLGGKTPFQVAAECREPIRAISNERILDMLLMEAPREWCTVGKKGIRIDKADYNAPELARYHGQKVKALYDPSDFGRVFVYGYDRPDDPLDPFAVAPGLHFVCIADCPDRLGLTREEQQARAKEIKDAHHGHVADSRKKLRKNAKTQQIENVAQEIMDHKKAQAADKVVAFPKKKVEHTSAGIAAAEAALEALDGQEVQPLSYEEVQAARAENLRNMTAPPLPDRPVVFGNMYQRAIWIADVMMGRQKGTLVDEDDEIIRTLPRANPPAYRAAQDILNWRYEDDWERYSEFRRAVGWPEARKPKG